MDANTKLVVKLLGVVVLMIGFVFAMIPLYDAFCEITGINGKTRGQALYQEQEVQDRLVTVQFLTDTNRGMPWEFRPEVNTIQVNPGKEYTVNFFVKNKASKDIVGQAIPSITPGTASLYFNKTECFCFDQQKLVGGESLEMPMRFFVDGDLPENVRTITLSYQLFNVTPEAPEVAKSN